MNWLRPAARLLKGRGSDETHVTTIQEMTRQWRVLVPELSLVLPKIEIYPGKIIH